MSPFEQAVTETLKWEGIYSNDPDDDGGETLCGISRKNYPKWCGWAIVDGILPKPIKVVPPNLMQMVKDFYKSMFWLPLKGDQFTDLAIVSEVFDFSVNAGQGRAVRVLQSALNLLNVNQQKYTDITEDGVIGPITISLTNHHPDSVMLLKMMKILRACYSINITQKNPKQEKYIAGWITRAIN